MKVADFWTGQRVVHSSRGEGTVYHVDQRMVYVEFDAYPKRPGIYDDRWLRECPPRGVALFPLSWLESNAHNA